MSQLNIYFLQHMMCKGILKCSEGDNLIMDIATKINEQPKDLNTIIFEINEQICQQLFKIDIKICEITGERYCVMINQVIDDISKCSSNHSAAELELFSYILTCIMDANSKCISNIICLNLTSQMEANITKDTAQYIIDSWIKGGYLVKKEGYIYLGARTTSEFEMFLETTFANRMTKCKLCTDYVYYGNVCSDCNEVLHIHCSSEYLQKTSKCPLCKKPWKEAEGKIYNEEEVDEQVDSYFM